MEGAETVNTDWLAISQIIFEGQDAGNLSNVSGKRKNLISSVAPWTVKLDFKRCALEELN